jgi:hypothetical protein
MTRSSIECMAEPCRDVILLVPDVVWRMDNMNRRRYTVYFDSLIYACNIRLMPRYCTERRGSSQDIEVSQGVLVPLSPDSHRPILCCGAFHHMPGTSRFQSSDRDTGAVVTPTAFLILTCRNDQLISLPPSVGTHTHYRFPQANSQKSLM